MTWLITKDTLADLGEPERTNLNAVGMTGPRTGTDAEVARLEAGEGEAFRMFDGDGELYYEGRWLEVPSSDGDEFEPLEDFGHPNAGCAYIEYRDPDTGKWVMS